MKLRYTTKNGKISVEFDGDSHRDLFEQINKFQEVFEEDVDRFKYTFGYNT